MHFKVLHTLARHNSADVDLKLVEGFEYVPILDNGHLHLLLQQVSLGVVLGQQTDLQEVDVELSFQVCKNVDLLIPATTTKTHPKTPSVNILRETTCC